MRFPLIALALLSSTAAQAQTAPAISVDTLKTVTQTLSRLRRPQADHGR